MKASRIRNLLALSIACTSITLVSCDALFNELINSIEQGLDEELEKIEIINADVEPKQPFDLMRNTNAYNQPSVWDYEEVLWKGSASPRLPSTGDVNVIVVPIQFTDRNKFSSDQLEAIKVSFNGSNENGLNPYWESAKSFYKKSSYGKLNLNFDIADPVVPNMTSKQFNNYFANGYSEVSMIIDYINGNPSLLKMNNSQIDLNNSKYDANDDGFIDGMWFVYNVRSENDVDDSHFWAYQSTYNGNLYDNYGTKLVPGVYANCALSFLYNGSAIGYDAHTLIHETGHMFGLDDYYSYDLDNDKFGYTGGLDMMDLNLGDHTAFSKYSLGWINPTIIYESSTTISLNTFENDGSAIILPSNSFNESAFSEYLILEYYTPTGLNQKDALNKYRGYYPNLFTNSGLLVYHVDARIGKIKYSAYTGSISDDFQWYIGRTQTMPNYLYNSSSSYELFQVAQSNTASYNYNNETFSLVSLMSADARQLYGSSYTANDNSLFNNTLQKNTFNIDKFSRFFANGSFNDGTTMGYEIKVNTMNLSSINLTITR